MPKRKTRAPLPPVRPPLNIFERRYAIAKHVNELMAMVADAFEYAEGEIQDETDRADRAESELDSMRDELRDAITRADDAESKFDEAKQDAGPCGPGATSPKRRRADRS